MPGPRLVAAAPRISGVLYTPLAGASKARTMPGDPLPGQRGGPGDTQAAQRKSRAGWPAAAWVERECSWGRHGESQVADVSPLRGFLVPCLAFCLRVASPAAAGELARRVHL